ncbi:biopolymer transporter ExbD [Synechococcales cyanobacterium C]|uniref:Biopolymer transporter ExbD n=1 Tax=Petrachloros mirabilis ULC683 TaxID=2781853 RepID=A0A8K2A0J6_9CYAN|nr:biopolymer transporter ExbD [Petrachloros mirabilis]NCJ07346.1 biopolymer transporter ExbD [Petrachloros mirabilis ULC683]
MRFRSARFSQIPEINLIPMMNVMMAVLAFFVMIATTLGLQQAVEIQLPGSEDAPPATALPEPLVIDLDPQGQMLLNRQVLNSAQLKPTMQTYLQANPKGAVVLRASQDLPYEQVIQALAELRAVERDRVSLAIE